MAYRSAAATAIVIAMGLTAAVSGQASKARGTVTVGTTTVTIATGMAVGYPGQTGQFVSVLLSDKPVESKTFATDTHIGAGERYLPALFEGAWKSQHLGRQLSGFSFTIGPKGLIMGDEFLVGGRDNTFGLGRDGYILELTSRETRIAGRLRTKMPVVDAGARKAGVDATFDLAIDVRK